MENATKALLIAAAVLIAILLISLGVGVFNSASEQMENADLSEYEIQAFNDKFKKYAGEKVSGSEVNALIDTVFNHNLAQDDATKTVQLDVSGKGGTVKIAKALVTSSTEAPKKVSTGYNYKVVIKYDPTTSLVSTITVTAI